MKSTVSLSCNNIKHFIYNTIRSAQLPAGAVLPAGRDRRGAGQHQHRQGGVLHPLQEGPAADHRHLAQGGVLRLRGRARRDLLRGTFRFYTTNPHDPNRGTLLSLRFIIYNYGNT